MPPPRIIFVSGTPAIVSLDAFIASSIINVLSNFLSAPTTKDAPANLYKIINGCHSI